MKPSPQLLLGDIVVYSPVTFAHSLSNIWSARVGKRARVVFAPITPNDVCGVVFEGEHETSYPLASNLKRLEVNGVNQKRITKSKGSFKL